MYRSLAVICILRYIVYTNSHESWELGDEDDSYYFDYYGSDHIEKGKHTRCQTVDKRAGICKPLVQCVIPYLKTPSVFEHSCKMSSGSYGVCCPFLASGSNSKLREGKTGRPKDALIISPPKADVPTPDISQQDFQEVLKMSLRTLKKRNEKISDIFLNKKIRIPKGSPAEHHQRFVQTSEEAEEIGRHTQVALEIGFNTAKMLKLSSAQASAMVAKISARGTPAEKACPVDIECDANDPFRSIDGSCNNLDNPDWGQSFTAFRNIVDPFYADGIASPRVQMNGEPLPSSRLISQQFMADEDRPFRNLTILLMQWGQFIDHDVALSPVSTGENGTGIFCCALDGGHLDSSLEHPECFPIRIPGNDPFFSRFGQTCMSFVRSIPAPSEECNLGPRHPLNQVSQLIDGSTVYGSTAARSAMLRLGEGGRLRAQGFQGRDYMPENPTECVDTSGEKSCFHGGDHRLNVQILLTFVHTIWFREHNRLARQLEGLNPNWGDERIFQEARRIVGACMQHINYNEYLPLILGPELVQMFGLFPSPAGHTQFYDPAVNPTITVPFAAAAYRFGHSMIQGQIKMMSSFASSQDVDLHSVFFKPFDMYDKMGDVARGLATQESQRVDPFATHSVTNHLFQDDLSEFGFDLMAINIKRGRDVGLAPYNVWREVVGFPRLTSWKDFIAVSDKATADKLSKIYPKVDEIDFFVGGLAETPVPGAVLGPTFLRIVADQFARLRIGDRFFYEEITAGFSSAQLTEIKKSSIARVLCDNTDNMNVIQILPFLKSTAGNGRVLCTSSQIPRMSLNPWKE